MLGHLGESDFTGVTDAATLVATGQYVLQWVPPQFVHGPLTAKLPSGQSVSIPAFSYPGHYVLAVNPNYQPFDFAGF